jgi:membrane associated rhomboid family serine protease
MFRFTPVVTKIIIANVVIYLLFSTIFQSPEVFHLFALHYPASPLFYPWQYITYMFLHSLSDFGHIFGNMFGVLVFGPLLEEFWGGKRFLVYYLICGVGAGVLYSAYQFYEMHGIVSAVEAYLEHPSPANLSYYFHEYDRGTYSDIMGFLDNFRTHPESMSYIQQGKNLLLQSYNNMVNVPMVGASGALFGILIAFAMLFPNTELIFFPLFIPIKAKYVVAVYGAIEYFSVLKNTPGDNVAHFAHIGGMIVGFIIVRYWQKKRNTFY